MQFTKLGEHRIYSPIIDWGYEEVREIYASLHKFLIIYFTRLR